MKHGFINIQLSDGSILNAALTYSRPEANICMVKIEHTQIGSIEKHSTDYFTALIHIRIELEPQGIKLLCWGARRDVWPKGIQFDWVAAILATRRGKDYYLKETKSIFEYSPPDTIASVEEQKKYLDKLRRDEREYRSKNNGDLPPRVYCPPWPSNNNTIPEDITLNVGPFATEYHQRAFDVQAIDKARSFVLVSVVPLATPGFTHISAHLYSNYDEPRYLGPLSIVKNSYVLEIEFSNSKYLQTELFSSGLTHNPDNRTFEYSEPEQLNSMAYMHGEAEASSSIEERI
ncbi:MAG: hypothetical protein ACOYL3_17460 [Desulfuromonadaceae bacterium]